ncbi:hypothetical protein R1flu_025232 [Riccia fluitans]|uniref:Oxidation resistance protein 1 n=1 Tax=Riccia fluitans TaxID=41844 RepID=A0ABD1XXJ6_9MARC
MAASESPIYVLVNRDLLEVQLADLPDVIDFGQPGLRVTKAQFVGVRYVGSGVFLETPKPPTHHHHRHHVTEVLKGFLGHRNHSQEQDSNSVHSGIRPLVVPELLMDSPDSSSKKIQWIKARIHPRIGDSRYHLDHYQNNGSKGSTDTAAEDGLAPTEFQAPLHFFQEAGYSTWELVWKEGKAGGPLKRLKFVTTDAGYRFVQNKLDSWASATHTSGAMNEAARAALDACGGQIKENPGHTERTSSFKRRNPKSIIPLDQAATNGDDAQKQAAPVLKEDQYIINLETLPLHGRLQPVCDSRSQVLEDRHIKALAAVLPVRFRSYKWTLLYHTERDGISLNTLYRKVHLNGPTIMVIRDRSKHVFGCYASEEWKVAARIYGTGECFVFQISPDMKAFKWTHANNMFMQSNLDYLAVGGGDHYSIMLDSDLLTGCSGPCITFGSPCLAGSEDFEVSMVEVWGFY